MQHIFAAQKAVLSEVEESKTRHCVTEQTVDLNKHYQSREFEIRQTASASSNSWSMNFPSTLTAFGVEIIYYYFYLLQSNLL